MFQKNRPPKARPQLEILEGRDLPSTITETFDSTPTGSLPAGWAQWSSSGSTVFAVTAAQAFSAPHGLAMAGSASSIAARAWLNTSQPADVQVSTDIYLNSLIPTQVLGRGSQLGSVTSTYYDLVITRGLTVQLQRVVNGTTTALGSLSSSSYTSGLWVRASLYINGTNLRAQVQRLDNAQYLNNSGQWQTDPAWSLNLTDTVISGNGFVGVGRPASYSGTITLDDFAVAPVIVDSQPPSVSIVAPTAGTTVTSTVTVQANATDNVGVTKVEFYVDSVLRAAAAAAPYSWAFDTTTATNGTHTLTVLAYDAAGNVGQATESLTTQNKNVLARPDIARHYPNIRIAELAYSGWAPGSLEAQLLQNSVDLVVAASANLGTIEGLAPNTPQLIYTNVSNLYLDLYSDWLTYADTHGGNREGAFYHVASATPFSGNSPSSEPVNWFWGVYRGSSAWTIQTSQARGTDPGGVAFGGAGQSLVLGYPERFREINLALSIPAGGGWSAALEYPAAVDAAGNPTAWAALTTLSNTTAGLTTSGQVTFDPPADWKAASVDGSARLYYVRFRTTASGTTPVARSLLGRDYVSANRTTSGTIPAFDAAADTDHDGYLNDAEYAHRAAGKDARFLYEARLFAPSYGQMRFAANPANPTFRAWAADYETRYLQGQPLADGLFVDNSGGRAPVTGGVVLEPLASYSSDYGSLLNTIGQAIAPRWLMANTAGGGSSADAVITRVQASFEEFALRPLAHTYQQFEDLAATVAHRETLTSPAPYLVLDSLPTGGSPTDPRTQLATLAYYYLLADPNSTFLDFYGGFEPATSWSRHWSPAAAFDVGQPVGSWSQFATGADPANAALTYRVYRRAYGNALVLYKPLSYGQGTTGILADATATTHALGGSYRVLQADGTQGPVVTSITLRNGEGAILVKVPAPTPPPAPPPAKVPPSSPPAPVPTGRGAPSTPVVPAAPVLVDVTGQVRLSLVRRLVGKKTVRMRFLLTNLGAAPLTGPLWLVLDNLGPRSRLKAGARVRPPSGLDGPAVLASARALSAGQSIWVTLDFDVPGPRSLVRVTARAFTQLDGTTG